MSILVLANSKISTASYSVAENLFIWVIYWTATLFFIFAWVKISWNSAALTWVQIWVLYPPLTKSIVKSIKSELKPIQNIYIFLEAQQILLEMWKFITLVQFNIFMFLTQLDLSANLGFYNLPQRKETSLAEHCYC